MRYLHQLSKREQSRDKFDMRRVFCLKIVFLISPWSLDNPDKVEPEGQHEPWVSMTRKKLAKEIEYAYAHQDWERFGKIQATLYDKMTTEELAIDNLATKFVYDRLLHALELPGALADLCETSYDTALAKKGVLTLSDESASIKARTDYARMENNKCGEIAHSLLARSSAGKNVLSEATALLARTRNVEAFVKETEAMLQALNKQIDAMS